MSAKSIPVSDNPAAALALPELYRKILVIAVLMLAGGAMAWISWLKWADFLVDFGEQVYVPWQLSEGKVLYRDISYLHGPLSSYLHALLFKVFGESILTLSLFNILIIAALTGLIYALFFQLSNRLTATVCSLAFITLFAFGHVGTSGNFNFVCAYTYELPHGVALSLFALHQFIKYFKTQNPARLMEVSFLTGLVFLTKIEVFVALSATLLCGGVVYFKTQPTGKLKATRNLLTALAIASIPPILFWIYFLFSMPAPQAMASLVSPWLLGQTSSLHSVPLYQWIIGTDAIGENLLKMLSCFFLYLLILVPLIALNRWLPRWTAHLNLYSLLTVLSILVLFFIAQDRIPWADLLRPLPLIMISLAVVSLMFLMKGNLDTADRGHYFALLVLSLFSFTLLLKMILNTHLFHYGFALAMPATLILIWILLYAIPNHKPLFTGPSTLYRNAMLVLIVVFIGKHVGLSYTMFNLKDYPVGTERGVLLDFGPEIDSRASLTHEAIQYINGKLPSHSDLATLPYGNMINYMTGHPNPLYYHTFNPGHALLFGEENYFTNLKAISPAHILLVDRDFILFGRRFFGRDYARQIYSWIVQNYEVQKQFGEIPFSGRGFGIQILKRNTNQKDPTNG